MAYQVATANGNVDQHPDAEVAVVKDETLELRKDDANLLAIYAASYWRSVVRYEPRS